MDTLKERFDKKYEIVPESGCWIWTGASLGSNAKFNYGRMKVNKVQKLAHRVSYELHKGEIGGVDVCVCHTCDVPECVNPDHLFLGTRFDNNKDMTDKGRRVKDYHLSNNKLSMEDVVEIRRLLFNKTHTQVEIAKKFNVSRSAIQRIHYSESWYSIDALTEMNRREFK